MYKLLIHQRSGFSNAGFTVMEVLAVVLIMAVLAAIAAPGWSAFQRRFELNAARDRVYFAFKQAQSQAKLKKTSWQASFRMQGNQLQYAIHNSAIIPTAESWQTISQTIQIDHEETTLPTVNKGSFYKVKFGDRGDLDTLGRITLIPKGAIPGEKGIKRCVFASTLIGTIRIAKENPKKIDGKYCY